MVSLDETGILGGNQGQTISRAAAVLRALARGGQGCRLTDVALETGLTKSTVLRLLRSLEAEGFALIDGAGAWRLGLGLVTLGAAAGNRDGLRHLAADALQRIAAETEDTVFFSLREGSEIVCVDRREGSFPIRTLILSPGDRRPLGVGAAGMAVLAFLDERDAAAALEAATPRLREWPDHSPEVVRGRAELARRRGYSLNDGRILSAMWAVGVPVRDGSRQVVAALSVAAITERMQSPRLEGIVAMLRDEAAAIERRFRIDADGVSAAPRVGPPVRAQGARGGRRTGRGVPGPGAA